MFKSTVRKWVRRSENGADAPSIPSTVLPPSPPTVLPHSGQHPASLSDVPRIFVIGAGSRGVAYARAIAQPPPGVEYVKAIVVGVAEPNEGKRKRFAERYMPLSELKFNDWRQMVTEDGKRKIAEAKVDGMFICKYLSNPVL